MRKMVVVAVLLVLGLAANAQLLDPVKWSYASKRVSASEALVYVKAAIAQGWHVYSTVQPEGGPLRTSFSFAASKDFSLVGKVSEGKPLSKFEKTFGMKVLYFSDSVVFVQRVKITSGKTNVEVKGSVEFMACTDSQCLPPSTVDFSVVVK